MSIKWMDDPSFYITSELTNRWTSTSFSANAPVINASNGRFGNPCWQNGGIGSMGIVKTLPGALVTGTVAVSFKWAAITTGRAIVSVYDSGTLQCDVRMDATGHIIVTRNGTQIGSTSASTVLINTWYRLEFKVTIDPSAGVIQVKINGVDYIASTGSLNTRNSANSSFNQVAIGGTGNIGGMENYNDYVCTDTNSPNANFLGDVRCYLRMPSSDSSVVWTPTYAAFLNSHAYVLGETFKDSNGNVQRTTTAGTSASSGTPTWSTTGGGTTTSGGATFTVVGTGSNPGAHNWMAVSEATGGTDGDSSYNADSTPGDIDLYGLPALPGGANNPLALDTVVWCRKDDAGTRTIQTQISSSGTTSNSASTGLSTSYQYTDFISETDPHTSAAWTVSGLNAVLVGIDEIA